MVRPIFKWAGGKQFLRKKLLELLPDRRLIQEYYEPFFGAGTLFFAYCAKGTACLNKVVLSDLNGELMETYKWLQKDALRVRQEVIQLKQGHSKIQFNHVRKVYNEQNLAGKFDMRQAARFVYLNRASFNGIYRVNSKGEYNVPPRIETPRIPSKEHFLSVQHCLRDKKLYGNAPYEHILDMVGEGAFVYLDPPYPPLDNTSKFTQYTKDKFGTEEQIKVAHFANELRRKGCYVMISNANTELIRKLFKGWHQTEVKVRRSVSIKQNKKRVSELIIRNYTTEVKP